MKKIPTMIPVVALAMIDRQTRVLMQRRPLAKAHGGLWEFPGGKVEPAETLDQALVREIGEELGVAIQRADLTPLSFSAMPGERHVLMLYICRNWQGEPECRDAQELGWFDPAQLCDLPMPPLDIPLAATLRIVLESAN